MNCKIRYLTSTEKTSPLQLGNLHSRNISRFLTTFWLIFLAYVHLLCISSMISLQYDIPLLSDMNHFQLYYIKIVQMQYVVLKQLTYGI